MKLNLVTAVLVLDAVSSGSFTFLSKSSVHPQVHRASAQPRYVCANNPRVPWKHDKECKVTTVTQPNAGTKQRSSIIPGRLNPGDSLQWDQPYLASSSQFHPGSTEGSNGHALDQFERIHDPQSHFLDEIRRVRNVTEPKNRINITGILEGNGPYLCGFRVSSELQSGQYSIFIREFGVYRCYFHGGTFRMKSSVFGSGFYQCFFQKPGFKLVVRQGIGQYYGFFQGIRHATGFLTPPPKKGPAEYRNFFYVFGSINYAVTTPDGKPLGMAQLLGIYNYGPEGTGRNFGLIQGIESYNLNLQSIVGVDNGDTKSQSEVLTKLTHGGNSDLSVNQVGQFQYHFYGADVDQGRGDQFKTFAYNFIHTVTPHIFTLQFLLYEVRGQGQDPLDDRQWVQAWAFYKYNFQNTLPQVLTSYFQTFVIGQFNFENPQLGFESNVTRLPGHEFIQFIIQFSKSFVGLEERDVGTVTWTGTFQSNVDTTPPDYLVIEHGDEGSELVVVDDIVSSVLHLLYNFNRRNGTVTGLIQLYVVYQRYLNQVSVEPPGYIQFVFGYFSSHTPFFNKKHSIIWAVGMLEEYVIGEPELSNGSYRVQITFVFDTTGWFEDNLESGIPPKPSSITFIAIYACLHFGRRTFHSVCYIQTYLYFIGTITGLSNQKGAGQTVLLCQYYQDVKV